MKTIFLITTILCSMGLGACCQTFSEWWRQKKTRIKYLRQQAAILEKLERTMEEGYSMAEEGVDSIAGITEDEFKDHEQFLVSLRHVEPVFKDSPETVTCYAMVGSLAEHTNEWIAACAGKPGLSASEMEWVSGDLVLLITHMRDNLRQLEYLTTDGNLTMKDDERGLSIREVESAIRRDYQSGMIFLRRVEELMNMRDQQAVNDQYLKMMIP